MARYGANHKAETRQRIIDTAGRRFKSGGLDGSGIAAVMGDAGLTNGAFYAHFASKSDLVAQVVTDQLDYQRATIGPITPGRDGLEGFIRDYLSAANRDDYAGGCPSAALMGEIGRADVAVRDAYAEGVRKIIEAIASQLSFVRTSEDRSRIALGLFTILVSSLQLSRAMTDPALRDQVLDAGVFNALQLIDETETRPRE